MTYFFFCARELQSAQSGPAPALSRGFPGHTAIAEEGLSPLRTGSVLATPPSRRKASVHSELAPCIPPQPLSLPPILVPLAAAPGRLPSPGVLPPGRLPSPGMLRPGRLPSPGVLHPAPPVLPVPPILPGFPALRGCLLSCLLSFLIVLDALKSPAVLQPQPPFSSTARSLEAELPSGSPGVRRALLRPLLPPLDGLRASARLLTQENQQGPVRASPEQQRCGINKLFIDVLLRGDGQHLPALRQVPLHRRAKISSIARNAPAPLGKYEAIG